MNYEIKLRMEKGFKEDPYNYVGSRIGTGWIEIESAFKFPVNILRTKDNKRMFVKYPSTQNKDGQYTNVVFPVQEGLREELDNAVIAEFHNLLRKGLNNPEISSVRVNILPEEIKNGKIAIKGYASIVISGIVINGIAIKESQKGLFVQMPQSRDQNGQYHDIIYGTNELMQIQIANAVLDVYERELELKQEKVKEYDARQYKGKEIETEISPKM